MSSLRIRNNWTTQTATDIGALSGQTKGSLSLFWRANAVLPGNCIVLKFPGSVYNVAIYAEPPDQLLIWANGASGQLHSSFTYTVGTVYHIALAWDAAGTQAWYVNGQLWTSRTTYGAFPSESGVVQFGSSQTGADQHLSDVAIWNGYALTVADITALANGSRTPGNLGTAASWWWTLSGTADAAANPTNDAGFANSGSAGSVSWGAPSGGGSAVYSSDALSLPASSAILDAYISQSGKLAFVLAGAPSLGFLMKGNNGVNTAQIASIRVTAGGSSYSPNPTATITGGSPSTKAVLGAPIVLGGKIVGIPVDNPGAGYLSTDSLSVVITDKTGSGASAAVTLGGLPQVITELNSQPTIKVNGSAATLNPTSFWTDSSHDEPWVAFQLQTAVQPTDTVTWSASSGWAAIGAGNLPAVAANTPMSNYSGVLEPAFRIPASGLSMLAGANAGSTPALNYSPIAVQANRAKNAIQGWSNATVATDGTLTSWTGANSSTYICRLGANPVDGQGIPYLAGPTLTPSGNPSVQAVLVPVINNGNPGPGPITGIVIVSGGTGYPNSGTVAVTGPGNGATATYTASGGVIQTVTVTAGGTNYNDGIWTLQYDDTAPATPTVAILAEVGGFWQWADLTGLPAPLGSRVSAGSGGVGITKAYFGAPLNPPGVGSKSPVIKIQVSGGTVSGSTHTSGMTNVFVTPPNQVAGRSKPVAPDQNMVRWLSFGKSPSGSAAYAGILRFMDSLLGIGGLVDVGKPGSSVVDASALPLPGDFAWDDWSHPASSPSSRGTYNFSISAIRPYDLGVSPNVFVDSPWPGAVASAGGSIAAYQWTPASRSYLTAYNTNYYAIECVTSSPHGLKTGQTVTLTGVTSSNPGPIQLLLQGGQSGGTAAAPSVANGANSTGFVLVTSPTTFLHIDYRGNATLAAEYPDDVLSAYCTQSTTYNTVNWINVTAGGSGFTGQANPPILSVAAPAGAWQTATAKVVVGSPAGSGTVSINSGSTALTFSTSQSGLTGQLIQITGDSSAGVYTIQSGSGTSWVVSPAYGGASNASGAAWTYYYGIVSVTPSGNNGSHYAFTPTCKIVGGGSGAGAVITANAPVGGAITGYTVSAPGSNYNTFVGLQVDPPGTTATATPTVTAGAVASLAVVSGGSGYTGGSPEVIITGDGTGASYTATVSGGVVTGFVKVSGGSGYTQANTSVAVALPPTQATGYIVGFNSDTIAPSSPGSGVLMIWPGTGYGTTPPAVTITGGGGTGATAAAVLTYPVTTTLYQPGSGTIAYEAAAALVAALPGCAFWCNIPPFASDACVTAIAQRVLAALPAGRKVYVQYGNELWNNFFSYHWSILGTLGGLSQQDITIARTAQVHAVFAAVFSAAGRGNDIVRVFGSQIGDGNGLTTETIAYANAHNIRVDAVCTAPYVDQPGDTAFATAAASCASALTSSTQYNTSWPWTMDMYHALYRHYLLYSVSIQDSFAADLSPLAGYTVPGYPQPRLTAYEGGIQHPIPLGVGTGGGLSAPYNGLVHDFFFHPSMADSVATWHLMCAKGGMAATCYFSLSMMQTSAGSLWTLVTQAGQQAGKGDGSDGLATNAFYVTDQKSHFLENVSPALAGFQAFAKVVSPQGTSAPARKWYPGLRRLATGLAR
jgi:hypothetical protein